MKNNVEIPRIEYKKQILIENYNQGDNEGQISRNGLKPKLKMTLDSLDGCLKMTTSATMNAPTRSHSRSLLSGC